MQFLGLASVAALVGIAGVGAASTLRDKTQPDVTATSEGNVSIGDSRAASKSKAPAPVVQAPAVVLQAQEAPVDSTPKPAPAPVTRPAPRGGFVLVEGKTQLTDSIYAIRTGDSVLVNFDAYGYRTRRSDKFEGTLRESLPLVFGRLATSNIDTLAAGQLVANHDVIGSLASEGMRITLGNGATARVRVLTREVTGGPIAIGYLAIIER